MAPKKSRARTGAASSRRRMRRSRYDAIAADMPKMDAVMMPIATNPGSRKSRKVTWSASTPCGSSVSNLGAPARLRFT